MVIFTSNRKLIKIHLIDGLKKLTYHLALNRQEKKTSQVKPVQNKKFKITDVNQ